VLCRCMSERRSMQLVRVLDHAVMLMLGHKSVMLDGP